MNIYYLIWLKESRSFTLNFLPFIYKIYSFLKLSILTYHGLIKLSSANKRSCWCSIATYLLLLSIDGLIGRKWGKGRERGYKDKRGLNKGGGSFLTRAPYNRATCPPAAPAEGATTKEIL